PLCGLAGRRALAADSSFSSGEDGKRHRNQLSGEIEAALAAQPAGEWAKLMNDNGVPAGEVLDVPSVLEHPQIIERALLQTFADVPNVNKPVSVVRSGFRLASGDPAPAFPPPALGADTGDLLAALGYSEKEIEELA